MTADVFGPFVEDAREALRTFLAALLGAHAPLDAGAPAAVTAPPVAEGDLVFLGQPAGADPFAVVLDGRWVDLFAQAMVGGPVPPEEAGDLLAEALGQAYGSVRTHASAGGRALPDASFTPAAAGALGGLAPGWQIPFEMADAVGVLRGSVLLPESVLVAAAPAPAAAPTAPDAPVTVSPVAFDDLGPESIGDGAGGFPDLKLLSDVELEVTVELGRRRLPLADVLRLTTGSVIELDKLVGQPLEVFANGRLIAEGEAVVIDDQFGVRVTSLASNPKHRSALV